MDSMYDDLLVELECPICTNYMSPPIRQCVTGHSICEGCRIKMKNCPMCKGVFSDSRNISLESLASKMIYPCLYKSSGCNERLTIYNRSAHEQTCGHRGFRCAMDKCNWTGPKSELSQHWASKSSTSKPYTASNVCHTKLKPDSLYVNMVHAFGQIFWFKCKMLNRKIFWSVQFIGESSQAEEYYYEIDMFQPGRTKKKILMSDYCQAIDVPNESLFVAGKCVSIFAEAVEHLLNENQNLVYNLRVHQVRKQLEGANVQAPVNGAAYKQRNRSKGPVQNRNPKPNKKPQHAEQQHVQQQQHPQQQQQPHQPRHAQQQRHAQLAHESRRQEPASYTMLDDYVNVGKRDCKEEDDKPGCASQ